MLVYDSIIEGYKAQEIANEEGISQDEAAKKWFEETFEDDSWTEESIKNKQFVCKVPYLDCSMYYDFGADYYFLAKENNIKENKNIMKKKEIVRINETQLHSIIKESVKRVLKESGYGNPARSNNIKKLQQTVRFVAEELKKYYDFDEESEWCGYTMNGTRWQGRLYDYDGGGYIDVCVRNYQSRVGTGNPETEPEGREHIGGVQVTGDIYDEYGTCLHNYVCACQGAPLGYMDRNLTPDQLVQRLIKDIEKCGLNNEDYED